MLEQLGFTLAKLPGKCQPKSGKRHDIIQLGGKIYCGVKWRVTIPPSPVIRKMPMLFMLICCSRTCLQYKTSRFMRWNRDVPSGLLQRHAVLDRLKALFLALTVGRCRLRRRLAKMSQLHQHQQCATRTPIINKPNRSRLRKQPVSSSRPNHPAAPRLWHRPSRSAPSTNR